MKIPAPAPEPAIWTEGLSKRYRRTPAVQALNLFVPRGEVFGFLGPNGAGKTTVVKMLLGLLPPTGGEGLVLGATLGDRVTRRRIGYLPEFFRYQDFLSLAEVLQAHGALVGLRRAERSAEAHRLLHLVGLGDRARDRVGSLSKGLQQRLGLAVALVGEPDLVFLDEPTSALDPVGRHEVREIIRGLRSRGVTVFLNSHLLTEVEQTCDRIAVLDQGRIITTGSLEELLTATEVRLRVRGLGPPALSELRRYGSPQLEGDVLIIPETLEEEIPELVAAIVAAGGRIYSVELRQASLEERFLGWIGGE